MLKDVVLLKNSAIILLLLSCSLCSIAQTPDANGILYVKKNATGTGDSWTNASGSFADALKAIQNNTDILQIWVAAGTWYPKYDGNGNSTSLQAASFYIKKDGLKIYGGFAGTETDITKRHIAANPTILSGDIGLLDYDTDNSFHVLVTDGSGTAITNTLLIDGFTITGGNANGNFDDGAGSGMYNNKSSPVLTNLIISLNSADYNGGGMYNNSSNPEMTNVIIRGNKAREGGGIYNNSSNPVLTNVTITGNKGNYDGGGMYNYYSNPVLTNVIITGNKANYYNGGGIYGDNSIPVLTNVTISGNDATSYGGGIYNGGGNPEIRNSIILGNTAATGNGIYNDYASSTISYSLVQDNTSTDDNNIDAKDITAPDVFISPANIYHPPPTNFGNYHLKPDADNPAINKGSNDFFKSGETPDLSSITTDLDSEARFDGVIDLGAYEFQSVALPVRLLSFTGEANAEVNLLRWQTADETAFSGFEIEGAFAQSRFSSIGFITAGGNSYQFTDNNVQPGIYYYRLKLLDIDGQFTYSKTIVLKRSTTENIQVFPVPVVSELNLVNAKGTLELHNSKGQLLLHQSITGNGPVTINVQRFAAGIYILRLRRTDGGLVVKKIVKQ